MKKIKKAFLPALVSVFLAGMTALAEGNGSVGISADQTSLLPGDTVTVTIQVYENPGIVTLAVYADYDESIFTLESKSPGGLLENNTDVIDEPGSVGFDLGDDTAGENNTGTGDVGSFVLKVREDAQSGDTTVNIRSAEAFDKDINDVSFGGSGMTFHISGGEGNISDEEKKTGSLGISADKTKLVPGDTVTMSIIVNENPGIATLAVYADYDESIFTLESKSLGGLLENNTDVVDALGSVGFDLGNDTAGENTTGTGEVGSFVLKVREGVEDGDTTVNIRSAEAFDKEVNEVSFSGAGVGIHIVTAPVPIPIPDPEPNPDPTPNPEPNPDPKPTPTPVPEPNPDPKPTPIPVPDPKPIPTPVPNQDIIIQGDHEITGLDLSIQIPAGVKMKKSDGTITELDGEALNVSIKPGELTDDLRKRMFETVNEGLSELWADQSVTPYVLEIQLKSGETEIAELTGEATVKVTIPENAGINFDKSVVVMRINNEAAEILDVVPVDSEPGTYLFQTDKFTSIGFVNVTETEPTDLSDVSVVEKKLQRLVEIFKNVFRKIFAKNH